jgi:diguanylate cyclase (GGDEF)-like protein
MSAPLPPSLEVHVALAAEDDAAAVLEWARDRGFLAQRAPDPESVLERALDSGRPALVVLDAATASQTLVEIRTLLSVSETRIGFLLVCGEEDWRRLVELEVVDLETISRPLASSELDWRSRRAFGCVRGDASAAGNRRPNATAVRLLAEADDPVGHVLSVLREVLPGAGIAIGRWRGETEELEDPIELGRDGTGAPIWREVEALLAEDAPLVFDGLGSAASRARLFTGAVPGAVVAVPIDGPAGGGILGAVLVWSWTAWPNAGTVVDLATIAARRLALEFEVTRLRERSQRLVARDPLTRLANRTQFNLDLHDALRTARATGQRGALLLINLDRFKTLNEGYGHAVGDRVLVECARRIRLAVRGSDLVARYGGDEFAVYLRDLRSRADAETVAAKIRTALGEAITPPAGETPDIRVTASIGICHFPDEAAGAEDLVRQADIALRTGKGLGTDQTHVFVADQRESRRERIALESQLREAEARGELRLHYQPQVAARDEDIVGVEALIRWERPGHGMVSPAAFVPIAEETGLIVPIGRWGLFEACRQVLEWQRRFGLPLRVAVNLSAIQLGQKTLVADVTAALAETGLPPDSLELEVTESVSVKRIPHLIETLESLRALGCQIAIDDFGTGQSSLDYIRRFPADRIKIDQVFVRNIGIDPDDEAIVRATIGMAHSLGRHVVAEGVEYEQHAAFLREQGCDELQGYLFCRPLAASALEELLAERERILARPRY